MSLTFSVQPGRVFQPGELVTNAKLNQLGNPVIQAAGTIGPTDLASGDYSGKFAPGAYFLATSVFAAGIYALTTAVLPAAYATGLTVSFVVDTTNTGAVDASIGALAAKNIFKFGTQELAAGDLRAGQIAVLEYDGTNFQLISALQVPPQYYQGTDTGTANAYAIALDPAPAALADITGKPIRFKVANANTGASTLAINALAATAIKNHKRLRAICRPDRLRK